MAYSSSKSKPCKSCLLASSFSVVNFFFALQLMNHFAQIGTPIPDARSGECTVVHGLTTALEALSECTEAQIDKLKTQTETTNKINNRGRVICIGNFTDDAYVRSLESFFQDSLVQLNKRNFGPDQMPIHQCDLVLVNIYPNAHTSKIKGNQMYNSLINFLMFSLYRTSQTRTFSLAHL